MPSVDDVQNHASAAEPPLSQAQQQAIEAVESGNEAAAGIDAARDEAEQLTEATAALGHGPQAERAEAIRGSLEELHGTVTGATGQVEAGAGALAEAVTRLDEIRTQIEQLRTLLSGGGSAAPRAAVPTSAASRSTTTAPASSGWESAPDLATSRDAMTKLGHVSPGREVHILDGDWDGIGGGHRWDSENPGKRKFPRSWDDAKIIAAITDVAQRPDDPPSIQVNGRWRCHGTRDGVLIRVVLEPDGSVRTGHPLSGPGVEKNPD